MNTTRKYKIHVAVELPMSHERIAYNLELEPEFHDEMKPIRTCSDDTPIGLQMATGELREYQAQPKREDRQNLAKRIAFKIATSLVAGMEHEDTHNGYKKNDEVEQHCSD